MYYIHSNIPINIARCTWDQDTAVTCSSGVHCVLVRKLEQADRCLAMIRVQQ